MGTGCGSCFLGLDVLITPITLWQKYDICYAYSPTGKWTNRHQLSINGKRDDFTKIDLLEAAKNATVKNAENIIREIAEVVSNWESYAKIAAVKQSHCEQIQQNLRLGII